MERQIVAVIHTEQLEGVAKGSEKKGTTKNTKNTKKSFSFPFCPSCTSWFKAFCDTLIGGDFN